MTYKKGSEHGRGSFVRLLDAQGSALRPGSQGMTVRGGSRDRDRERHRQRDRGRDTHKEEGEASGTCWR